MPSTVVVTFHILDLDFKFWNKIYFELMASQCTVLSTRILLNLLLIDSCSVLKSSDQVVLSSIDKCDVILMLPVNVFVFSLNSSSDLLIALFNLTKTPVFA